MRSPLEHYLTALPSGPWTDVDDIVGSEHHVTIMFDDDDGVSQVTQLLERLDEPFVVALVESDAGFVEDIEHVDELGTYLCGESDALALAS